MLFFFIAFVFLTFLSVFLLFSFITLVRYQSFRKRKIVGPKPEFPFGNTRKSTLGIQNLIYDVDDSYQLYRNKGPFFGFFSNFRPFLIATDPEFIKFVTMKEFNKFRNNNTVINPTKDPLLARSPFRLKDDAWKSKRNETTPVMTPIKLKGIYPLVRDKTQHLIDYIKREIEADDTKIFDARNICTRCTCDTISSLLFDVDAKSFETDSIYYKMGEGLIRGVRNAVKSSMPFKKLPKQVENFFKTTAMTSVKQREENKIERSDLLAYFMYLKERKGISDLDLVGHCTTFFLDGYETSSLVTHHILYELGKHQDVQQKLREEIQQEGDDMSYEKLFELPYLDQVFNEALRLHPPLPFATRVCSEDVEFIDKHDHKFEIKKGDVVWVPLHSVQRDPDHFSSPLEFDPERYNPENGGTKPYAEQAVWIPFGEGPRKCPGVKFGNMQVKTAIVEVVKNFIVFVDESTVDSPRVGPKEYFNATGDKIYLKFKNVNENI
ncbi:CLUMA_CG016147, isoform A [Clunio marinus]|uniref:CLUMA_CG016147, isoform A n=1 Tax=Clunio marinus TaxID=568069 RepID=A0A1J1IVU8_9DIPT|nr:CLUMA_CG016147, isoform A [Clunio marinus]